MASIAVTLLLTNSLDRVADSIVTALGSERVFRYNSDLWQEYKLRISGEAVGGETIELENAAGRRITDAQVAKVYRRSSGRASEFHPDRPMSAEERYMEEEVWSAWNEIVNLFWMAGKVVLVQPYALVRLGKLQQLRMAGKHFSIPSYAFLLNRPDRLRPGVESVAKSFNFKYATGVGFYSTRVREDQLDPKCPWFITDLVEAEWDVTVAVVRDQLFAFALDRGPFLDRTIDWRLASHEHALRDWKPVELPESVAQGLFAFMREAGAHYARVDFLRSGVGYLFLEANFSGEWDWLDPEGRHGLRDKVLHEIDPRTPLHACPRFAPVS